MLAGIVVALLSIFSTVRADTVIRKNESGGAGLPYSNVRVDDFKDGELVYTTSSGEQKKDLPGSIFKITIDRDPVLTAGEDAFVAGKWDVAVDSYLKIVRGGEEWKRRWSIPRLMIAAQQAGRFDASAAGFIALVKLDPAAAATARPTPPEGPSKLLDDVVKEVTTALRDSNDQQKAALLSFILDLHRARKDEAAQAATLEELSKLSGALESNPELSGLLAGIRIGQARAALNQKKFDETLQIIESNQSIFVDPPQQAQAMYLLAQATEGKASKDDKTALQDAALKYMAVAAHFDSLEGQPFVGDSLLAAARLCALAGLIDDARSINESVIRDFPDTPFAVQAQKQLDALK